MAQLPVPLPPCDLLSLQNTVNELYEDSAIQTSQQLMQLQEEYFAPITPDVISRFFISSTLANEPYLTAPPAPKLSSGFNPGGKEDESQRLGSSSESFSLSPSTTRESFSTPRAKRVLGPFSITSAKRVKVQGHTNEQTESSTSGKTMIMTREDALHGLFGLCGLGWNHSNQNNQSPAIPSNVAPTAEIEVGGVAKAELSTDCRVKTDYLNSQSSSSNRTKHLTIADIPAAPLLAGILNMSLTYINKCLGLSICDTAQSKMIVEPVQQEQYITTRQSVSAVQPSFQETHPSPSERTERERFGASQHEVPLSDVSNSAAFIPSTGSNFTGISSFFFQNDMPSHCNGIEMNLEDYLRSLTKFKKTPDQQSFIDDRFCYLPKPNANTTSGANSQSNLSNTVQNSASCWDQVSMGRGIPHLCLGEVINRLPLTADVSILSTPSLASDMLFEPYCNVITIPRLPSFAIPAPVVPTVALAPSTSTFQNPHQDFISGTGSTPSGFQLQLPPLSTAQSPIKAISSFYQLSSVLRDYFSGFQLPSPGILPGVLELYQAQATVPLEVRDQVSSNHTSAENFELDPSTKTLTTYSRDTYPNMDFKTGLLHEIASNTTSLDTISSNFGLNVGLPTPSGVPNSKTNISHNIDCLADVLRLKSENSSSPSHLHMIKSENPSKSNQNMKKSRFIVSHLAKKALDQRSSRLRTNIITATLSGITSCSASDPTTMPDFSSLKKYANSFFETSKLMSEHQTNPTHRECSVKSRKVHRKYSLRASRRSRMLAPENDIMLSSHLPLKARTSISGMHRSLFPKRSFKRRNNTQGSSTPLAEQFRVVSPYYDSASSELWSGNLSMRLSACLIDLPESIFSTPNQSFSIEGCERMLQKINDAKQASRSTDNVPKPQHIEPSLLGSKSSPQAPPLSQAQSSWSWVGNSQYYHDLYLTSNGLTANGIENCSPPQQNRLNGRDIMDAAYEPVPQNQNTTFSQSDSYSSTNTKSIDGSQTSHEEVCELSASSQLKSMVFGSVLRDRKRSDDSDSNSIAVPKLLPCVPFDEEQENENESESYLSEIPTFSREKIANLTPNEKTILELQYLGILPTDLHHLNAFLGNLSPENLEDDDAAALLRSAQKSLASISLRLDQLRLRVLRGVKDEILDSPFLRLVSSARSDLEDTIKFAKKLQKRKTSLVESKPIIDAALQKLAMIEQHTGSFGSLSKYTQSPSSMNGIPRDSLAFYDIPTNSKFVNK